jgi:hypothetical protein
MSFGGIPPNRAPLLYSDAHAFDDVSVTDPTTKEAHKLQYLLLYEAGNRKNKEIVYFGKIATASLNF